MSDVTTMTQAETGLECTQGFETLQRIANMFAASSLVPKDFQGNLPNCAIALHMALRMKADPLMVMQNLYVVHGRPGWSSQFLIATFNQSGKFSALRYRWSGSPGADDYGCTACAVEKATAETLEGATITIGLAKKEGWYGKNGSKWQTMPQQMLMYRAAAFFVRAYAPELAMGLPTQDEILETTHDQVVVSTTAAPTRSEQLAVEMASRQASPVVVPPVTDTKSEPVATSTPSASVTPPTGLQKPFAGPVPTLADIADAKVLRRINQLVAEVKAAWDADALTPDAYDALNDAIVARQNELSSKGGA